MKDNKGFTLVALIFTVTVLAIITSIVIYSGMNIVKRANLESMRSNMLLIQAKVKEYAEEADFKMGPNNDVTKKDEVYTNYNLESTSEVSGIPAGYIGEDFYYVSETALNNMGLNKIAEDLDDDEKYIVEINIDDNISVEVYNTLGYQGHYSLSELEELQ